MGPNWTKMLLAPCLEYTGGGAQPPPSHTDGRRLQEPGWSHTPQLVHYKVRERVRTVASRTLFLALLVVHVSDTGVIKYLWSWEPHSHKRGPISLVIYLSRPEHHFTGIKVGAKSWGASLPSFPGRVGCNDTRDILPVTLVQ